MPEICRFFGIIIMMFPDDHNPPHFLAKYGNCKALIYINKGDVEGRFPRKALNRVYQWLDLHYDELMANWERLKKGKEPLPIEPLEK